jgi:hypothetical protein
MVSPHTSMTVVDTNGRHDQIGIVCYADNNRMVSVYLTGKNMSGIYAPGIANYIIIGNQ